MLNDTLIPGNFHAYNGLSPGPLCYDPGKDVLFVTDSSGIVSVISAAQRQVIAMIPVDAPLAIACDVAKGEAFVASNAVSTGSVAVISDATYTVVANITVGTSPQGLVYDGGRNEIFVAIGGSSRVSAISDTNNSVVANIGVGSGPEGMAYDSGKGEIFVVNRVDNSISVISDATNKVVATSGTGYGGGGSAEAAYDPETSEIFVSNPLYNTLSVISDATNSVVAYIATGSNPVALAYDSGTREIVVTDAGSNNVSVISDVGRTVVATIPVGDTPFGVAYDNASGELFVANMGSNTVSVVSDSTNVVRATIPTGHTPSALAYDDRTRQLFVADGGSGTVWVISDSTSAVLARVTVGRAPQALAYDSGRGEIFVANGGSDTLSVISDATDSVLVTIPVGSNPYQLAYDGGKGEIFVTNIGFSPNVVSVVSDVTNSIVANISLGEVPSGLAYDGGKGEVFVAKYGNSPGWGGMSVISDATNQVIANISVPTSICCPGPMLAYDGDRGEILLGDSSGAITVISDSTNAVTSSIPVARWPAALTYASRNGEIGQSLVADSRSSNLGILLDATNTVVANVTVGGLASSIVYDSGDGYDYVGNVFDGTLSIVEPEHYFGVSFEESGLPSGTAWSVALGGTTIGSSESSHFFSETNGTYAFVIGSVRGYSTSPSSGQVLVNGANVTVRIAFIPVPFRVTFNETGLLVGMLWWVNLTNGDQSSSAASETELLEANGTYGYSIGTTDKRYWAGGGTFSVQGSPVTISVTFRPVTYALMFSSVSLPAGASWSVNLSGVPKNAGGSSIVFAEMNGTYDFVIGPPNGYDAAPASGAVKIHGAAETVSIQMTPKSPATMYVYIGGVALGLGVAGVVAFLFIRRRRRTRPPVAP